MADFSMLDIEFRKWSPTFVDKGGNPTTIVPPGSTITYSTDNPSILQLSFDPPATRPDLPSLNADGTEGIYVGSGALGTANVTADPTGAIDAFETVTKSVEILPTEAGSLNMTFGDPIPEKAPPPAP